MTTYCVYWRKTTTTRCRCCLPSVNTTCGDIMIGLSLPSISKHNMWSYYKPDFVINLFVIKELYCIVFTDERQQRQPNHNTTTYYMWSYYDWVYCCCRPSVNIICGRIMIGLVFTDGRQRQPNHNTTIYHVYWRTTTTINPIIIRPHCMFTEHNMWSYYDWVVVVFRQ
jgi:hypothetical protein